MKKKFLSVIIDFFFFNLCYCFVYIRKIDSVQPAVMPKAAFSWDAYYDLAGIYGWLDSVVAGNPSIAQTIIGGSTHEGRQIKGVKLSYKAGNPGVFIESCIHAREWIGCATSTWILNELITSSDPAVRNIAENYDWYFFPVTNPDGYEFTHTNVKILKLVPIPNNFFLF